MPTKYPPSWGLSQCVKAIKDIYGIHSKERFNNELIAELLETTKTSSNFTRRILALQVFGLLNKTGETVQLSELAIQIVNPVAGEDREARITAFRKVDVLDDLLGRYPNAKLPPDSNTIKTVLLQSLGIHRDTVSLWYTFVLDSFKAIAGMTDGSVEERPISEKQESNLSKPAPNGKRKTSVVWLPSGKSFEFSVEEGYTVEDMNFVLQLLNLFKASAFPVEPKKEK